MHIKREANLKKAHFVMTLTQGQCLKFTTFMIVAFLSHQVSASNTIKQPHIEISLIADVQSVRPGDDFFVALQIAPEEGWHVYWRNPGDSGLPITMSWKNPSGAFAGEVRWPAPIKFFVGPLVNYGYEGQLVLPIAFSTSAEIQEKNIVISAEVNWLLCKDACIPGRGTMDLSIPVNEKTINSVNNQIIKDSISSVPKRIIVTTSKLSESGEDLLLELTVEEKIFNGATLVEFFPINESVFSTTEPDIKFEDNHIQMKLDKSDSFTRLPELIHGVLVVDKDAAWEFTFHTQSP